MVMNNMAKIKYYQVPLPKTVMETLKEVTGEDTAKGAISAAIDKCIAEADE